MRILLVVHGFPPAASGGTEVYVRDLAQALAAVGSDEVRVLTRDGDPHRPELDVRHSTDGPVRVASVNNTFQACGSFEDSYANPAIAQIAGEVLDGWRPDVVHVQHLTCLSTGIPGEAARRRIPVVLTLNDYWFLCHRGQLVDLDGRRCAGPGEAGCARCLPPGILAGGAGLRVGRQLRARPGRGAAAAAQYAARALDALTPAVRTQAVSLSRLRHMQAALSDVDLFLAPSDTLAAAFSAFGIPPGRLIRCTQGIALAPFEGLQRTESAALRAGFAGGFLPTKGPDVLLDAVDRLPPGKVRVDLLGSTGAYHGETAFASALARRLGHPAIRRLGPVPHDRMPAIFADLDVLIVPSTWIENAPFIIREAFAAGVPVIASDLGGMAEMVRDGRDGLLFPPGDAGALADRLRRLIEDPGLLRTLRAGIVRPVAIEEDAARLRELYGSLAHASAFPARFLEIASDPVPAAPAARLAAVVLNYRTPDQTWLAVRSLQTSRRRPSDIVVVDNASGDGSVERLRRSLEQVRVVASPENAGFPGGCNIGIESALGAGADLILLVNSDVVLAPDTIDRLLAALAGHPRLGIVAPVLLSREEPDRIASAGIAFSRRTGRMRHRAAGRRLSALAPASIRIVDAVSGGVMLIRRRVFEESGLFDDQYFFSFEDIDFCLRAAGAGFETGCVQNALAYHEGGRSIGPRSPRRVYFATRNHLRLAAQAGSPAGRPLRTGIVLGLNAAYVLLSPEAPLFRGAGALARGAWHHFTGRYGPD